MALVVFELELGLGFVELCMVPPGLRELELCELELWVVQACVRLNAFHRA